MRRGAGTWGYNTTLRGGTGPGCRCAVGGAFQREAGTGQACGQVETWVQRAWLDFGGLRERMWQRTKVGPCRVAPGQDFRGLRVGAGRGRTQRTRAFGEPPWGSVMLGAVLAKGGVCRRGCRGVACEHWGCGQGLFMSRAPLCAAKGWTNSWPGVGCLEGVWGPGGLWPPGYVSPTQPSSRVPGSWCRDEHSGR